MIVKDLLKDYSRLDKRDILESRKFTIEKLQNFYLITQNNTQILAMYHKSICKPYIDKPNEGKVFFTCVSNKRTDKLTSFLKKIYLNQKSIDLESLCIKYSKEVYSLQIELRILTSDGKCYEPSVLIINHILQEIGISTNFLPSCFYFIAIDNVIIRDPIYLEDKEKDWYYLIALKNKNEYIYIEKVGKENSLDDIYNVLKISTNSY